MTIEISYPPAHAPTASVVGSPRALETLTDDELIANLHTLLDQWLNSLIASACWSLNGYPLPSADGVHEDAAAEAV